MFHSKSDLLSKMDPEIFELINKEIIEVTKTILLLRKVMRKKVPVAKPVVF